MRRRGPKRWLGSASLPSQSPWLCKRAGEHRNAKREHNHLEKGGYAFVSHFGRVSSGRIRQRGRGEGRSVGWVRRHRLRTP